MHFYKENGIQRNFSMKRTPQHTSVAERMNKTLKEKARCLQLYVGLSKGFLVEALNMACYLVNKSPHALMDGKVA